jgi:hypothetical protein
MLLGLIMERAAAALLPTIYEWPETAEEGGFAAYGPRVSQLYAEIMPQQTSNSFAAPRSPTSLSNSRLSSSW